jgi:hypothetical protein
MYGYILELCDDLAGELDIVAADLHPLIQGSPAPLWAICEMRLHLRDLRSSAIKETSVAGPSHSPPETVLTAIVRIKALLKQVDQ